jgi:hypothetical protein
VTVSLVLLLVLVAVLVVYRCPWGIQGIRGVRHWVAAGMRAGLVGGPAALGRSAGGVAGRTVTSAETGAVAGVDIESRPGVSELDATRRKGVVEWYV